MTKPLILILASLIAVGSFCGCKPSTGTDSEVDLTTSSDLTEMAPDDDSIANAMASGINALDEASQLSSSGISMESAAALELESENPTSEIELQSDERIKLHRKRRFRCDRHDPDLFITFQCKTFGNFYAIGIFIGQIYIKIESPEKPVKLLIG